jgi:uncharacterized protein (TIRG00374 family)
MKLRSAFIAFWLLTLAYLGLLFWIDQGRGQFSAVGDIYAVLPLLLLCTLAALLFRFWRWHWLLVRAGFRCNLAPGVLAYFAGFAFTATPGKVGELIRIRYLQPLGVPASTVISAFVFERALDLIVVLGIAMLAAWHWEVFPMAAGCVLFALTSVVVLARNPALLDRLAEFLRGMHFMRPAHLVDVLKNGLVHAGKWFTPLDLVVSFALGGLAWGLTAFAFMVLLGHLGVNLPILQSLSLYPAAMLAGAASMLPGGIGSTEAVLVTLLAGFAVPLSTGALAAIGIRLATLWFAMLLGIVAMLLLARTRNL